MRCYASDRKPWTLFATACRIAQGMELLTDGMSMNLPAFETEIRRRLLWQIVILDVTFAESRSFAPLLTPEMFDTRQPLNISDEQLSPVAGLIGQEQEGSTEMTFSLISQNASAAMQVHSMMNPRNRPITEETIAMVEKREQEILHRLQEIKSKYIDHCDPSVPVLWMSAETGRIIILRIWLLLQRPMYTRRAQVAKAAKREFVLAAAVSMLELVTEFEYRPETQPYRWYLLGYAPWYVIAIIMAELCVQTKGMLVDRAWNIINKVYDTWNNRLADSGSSGLLRPIRKMMEQARKARQDRLSRGQNPTDLGQPNSQNWIGANIVASDVDVLNPELKRLQYAAVAQALGNPEELEALLAEQQVSPPMQLDQNLPADDFAEVIDWNDWDNFVQTAMDAENQSVPAQADYPIGGDFGYLNTGILSYETQLDKDLLPNSPAFNFGT